MRGHQKSNKEDSISSSSGNIFGEGAGFEGAKKESTSSSNRLFFFVAGWGDLLLGNGDTVASVDAKSSSSSKRLVFLAGVDFFDGGVKNLELDMGVENGEESSSSNRLAFLSTGTGPRGVEKISSENVSSFDIDLLGFMSALGVKNISSSSSSIKRLFCFFAGVDSAGSPKMESMREENTAEIAGVEENIESIGSSAVSNDD